MKFFRKPIRFTSLLIGALVCWWLWVNAHHKAPVTHTPTTYAVIAAISDYKMGNRNDLPMTVPSAAKFYAFLTNPRGMAIPTNQIRYLVDANANRNNILKQLDYIFSFAQPQDRVLFYFSGHGDVGELLPYDDDFTSQQTMDQTALKDEELRAAFKRCRADTKLCFVEACHSGSLTKKGTVRMASSGSFNRDSNKGPGVLVMMSSQSNETSIGDAQLNEGVFSHVLTDGLRGKADANRNRVITAYELAQYVQTGVTSYARQKFNAPQHPVVYGRFDDNMPIVTLR